MEALQAAHESRNRPSHGVCVHGRMNGNGMNQSDACQELNRINAKFGGIPRVLCRVIQCKCVHVSYGSLLDQ